ncbi:Exodeoxyribonuclease 8 [Providencia stuartii]|nr:Exodeoxyribonuclease 8 [Providencia stuartii]
MKEGIYYNISNEDYHNGLGISKSQLDLINESPADFIWHRDAPVDKEKTKALDFGTALHCLLLEPG